MGGIFIEGICLKKIIILFREFYQLLIFPVVPPASQLLVIYGGQGQDPIAIAGVGTPVAVKAAAAHLATVKTAGGGLVILDPLAGTGGLVVTATGVDVIGALSVGGTPVP